MALKEGCSRLEVMVFEVFGNLGYRDTKEEKRTKLPWFSSIGSFFIILFLFKALSNRAWPKYFCVVLNGYTHSCLELWIWRLRYFLFLNLKKMSLKHGALLISISFPCISTHVVVKPNHSL